MKVSALLASLFAVSLVSGAALAENPRGGDGRHAAVKERIQRESRTRGEPRERASRAPLTERRSAEKSSAASSSRVSDSRAPGKVREVQRGCSTDDGSSCTRGHRDPSREARAKKEKESRPTGVDRQKAEMMIARMRAMMCQRSAGHCSGS